MDDNERNVQCGVIRAPKDRNLESLYFDSPYYYQYKTGN